MSKHPNQLLSNSSQPNRDTPQPIPVKQIRFVGPQDGACLSAATVVNGVARNARGVNGQVWHIDYMPWIRSFRVTHVPPKGGGNPKTAYIPEGRVMFWIPLEDDSELATK